MSGDWPPRSIGHATSIDGEPLTIYPGLDGVGQVAFDHNGCGPYLKIVGCPNCGKHAGEWWTQIQYAGWLNSGVNPNEPCSRVCRYQLEWQTELAARRLTGSGAVS